MYLIICGFIDSDLFKLHFFIRTNFTRTTRLKFVEKLETFKNILRLGGSKTES